MTYDPDSYWTELHQRRNLSSVGQSGYSAAWNQWLYRAWLRSGRRFLWEHRVTASSVCEVGAGTGAWFPVWRSLGARHITAIDLVDVESPADRRLQLDIGDRHDDLGNYDLVAAMYVLLHVTDDIRFHVALNNLAQMVAPRGWLLIAEPIRLRGHPDGKSRSTSVARSIEAFQLPGLELEAMAAATIVAGDPVEHRSLPVRAAFGAFSRIGSRIPSLLGPLVARVDPWLVAHTGWAPSAKLALFRRP